MGNSIGKTTINSDAEVFSRISSDSASASSGNFANPNSIIKEYWTDGEVEVIDMEDGTYLLEQDGTAMGWTDAEGANSILGVNDNNSNTPDPNSMLDDQNRGQGESSTSGSSDSVSETIQGVSSEDDNASREQISASNKNIETYEDGSYTYDYIGEDGNRVIDRYEKDGTLTNTRKVYEDGTSTLEYKKDNVNFIEAYDSQGRIRERKYWSDGSESGNVRTVHYDEEGRFVEADDSAF